MASFETRGSTIRAIVRQGRDLPKLVKAFDNTPAGRKAAEAWAKVAEAKKDAGIEPSERGSSIAASDLFEEYEEKVCRLRDTARFDAYRIGAWMRDVRWAKPVDRITTFDVNEWIAARCKEVSPATANRELNLMSGAFAYAIKVRGWIKVNPCHGAQRPAGAMKRRDRDLLTPDEIKAIRIASGIDKDPELRTKTARVGACFLFALETGMRSGEILRLRPRDFDPARSVAHVAAIEAGGRKAAKSGRATVDASRDVPLTATAAAILARLLATMPEGSAHIVGVIDGTRDALWRKIMRQAGVEGLTFHDTKHEAATRLAAILDPFELSHAIGTKDLKLIRDTYYNNRAERVAKRLPSSLMALA